MYNSTRREFLKSTTCLVGFTLAGMPFNFKNKILPLSFSTLGCPDWTFEKIINFAAENNYNGIELRGILRELDLTKCPEFSTAENISATRKLVESKGLQFVDLGSSSALHHAEKKEREKNLGEAKRFIDLAKKLGCPFVRVFPNNLPKDESRNAVIDLIISGLLELGEYANGSSVTVLMETHGDVVHTDDLIKIMEAATHKNVGLIWDVVNMWSVTKEPPAGVYEKLKKYIRHTHIKDLKLIDGKEHYTLVGKGDTPILQAVDILQKGNYKGYYSFEWEKLWHPEIEEPETALADYSKVMRQRYNPKNS